jgi:hypothetical protein
LSLDLIVVHAFDVDSGLVDVDEVALENGLTVRLRCGA